MVASNARLLYLDSDLSPLPEYYLGGLLLVRVKFLILEYDAAKPTMGLVDDSEGFTRKEDRHCFDAIDGKERNDDYVVVHPGLVAHARYGRTALVIAAVTTHYIAAHSGYNSSGKTPVHPLPAALPLY